MTELVEDGDEIVAIRVIELDDDGQRISRLYPSIDADVCRETQSPTTR